jgi:dipeptidase E
MKKSILLISSSYVSGSGYLDPFEEAIKFFLKNIQQILFVPYAADKTNWDSYTRKVRQHFNLFGIDVRGIHEPGAENEIDDFKAIFIGGGNTFRLLYRLQQFDLLSKINDAVLNKGMLYMGSSAGSNVACKTICTTNDIPIIYPPKGFDGINLIPLQIKPHYIDPDPNSTQMGETGMTELKNFMKQTILLLLV